MTPSQGDSMRSTMRDVPLSLNHLLERAGTIFAGNTIVSRLPDKSLRTHAYGEYRPASSGS
jgi:fatty-acyl-CoA synthase